MFSSNIVAGRREECAAAAAAAQAHATDHFTLTMNLLQCDTLLTRVPSDLFVFYAKRQGGYSPSHTNVVIRGAFALTE